jgi:hypothetical protein
LSSASAGLLLRQTRPRTTKYLPSGVSGCHAVELTLGRGRGGEVYFVSDGEPAPFRTIVSALIETQGLDIQDKTVPRFVVRAVAGVGDLLAKLSGGRIVPPLTLQAYATSAVEVTFSIGKARRFRSYRADIARPQRREDGHLLPMLYPSRSPNVVIVPHRCETGN